MKANLFRILMAFLMVLAGVFSFSRTTPVAQAQSLSAGCQFIAGGYGSGVGPSFGMAGFTFNAGEQVTFTAGTPIIGIVTSIDLNVNGSIVSSSPFPGTLTYTFPTTGPVTIITWGITSAGSATWQSSCGLAPVSAAGGIVPECVFGDGRINDRQCAAPVVLYCNADNGVDVYVLDPGLGKFVFSFRLGEGETGGQGNVSITQDANGLFVVSTTYDTGKPYVFAWDGCPVTETHIISY